VRALQAAKKDFVRFSLTFEGHGIDDERDRIKIYRRLERFLQEKFPAR